MRHFPGMSKPPKKHGRAYGNTQLTISIPVSLKERIAAEAAAEERSISNWCVLKLRAVIARQGMLPSTEAPLPSANLKVAEQTAADREEQWRIEHSARVADEAK